jgi:hypothetical protein
MATTPYETLLESASRLADVDAIADVDEGHILDASSLIARNRLALEAARRALGPNCVVQVRYEEGFIDEYLEHMSLLRNLTRAFRLELWLAASSNDLRTAARVGMEILDLANVARRGGLLIGLLVSNAISGIALETLRGMRQRLDGVTRPLIISQLHRIDCEREPFSEITSRDQQWEIAVGCEKETCDFSSLETSNWGEAELSEEEQKEIIEALKQVAELPPAEMQGLHRDQDLHILALIRLLAVDLAIRGFHADFGSYPDKLSRLTPRYLESLPRDSFTDKSFLYRRSGDNSFYLYSTGPKLTDGGGHFGPWPLIAAGLADLCLDANDYWSDCGD